MSTPQIILWNHPVSSYAQKVRIALRHKNIPFEARAPLNLTGPGAAADPTFLRANPRGEVPVLTITDASSADPLSIVDSRVIVEYLDERFPEVPLLPRIPEARAKARMIEQVCDAQYEAINWGLGEIQWMGRGAETPEVQAHVRAEGERQTREVYAWLEERIEPSGWLAGDAFSVADATVGPVVYRSVYFGIAPAEGSKLAAWLEKVKGVESVKETLREFDEGVGAMSGLAEAFLSGKRKREYRDYRLEFLVKSGGIDIVLKGLKDNNIRFPWPEGRLRE